MKEYPINGVFVDLVNKTIWENTSSTLQSAKYTWYQAEEYCNSLSISDYTNWRLSSRKELHQLYQSVNGNSIQEASQIQKKYNSNSNFGIWSDHTEVQNVRGGYTVTYGSNAYDGQNSSSFIIDSKNPYSSKTRDDYHKTQVICILDS
ncbi:DUF1566 domain-containing protein [Pseudoalteromonas sp. '520P1 No. 423']|uniref:Lcl domain-containing protein n=1 Tax=Pseudoalteromonas sp. '520P1 No. 423' TaxID=1690037 RepID=UPI000750CE11|nr:DUF1566 domain-containing protein [Pseudoalteromonas sp. '520P1 No. 423']